MVYDPASPSKSFAALKITSTYWEPAELINSSGDGWFVCPKAFKTYFRRQVEDILQHRRPDSMTKLCTSHITIFYVTDKGLYTYSRRFIDNYA